MSAAEVVMFDRFKANRAAARMARDSARAQQRDLLAQQQQRAKIAPTRAALELARTRLDAVQSFNGLTGADIPDDVTIVLHASESLYCFVTGAVLVEPKKGPGEWKGHNQGVSIPVPGTRMRYRVGQTKGHFQQGEETPTPIDEGTFAITSTRAVFAGQKQSREWAWSKLLSVTHYEPGWTAMAVSNRQKISGVGVDAANVEAMRFMIELAVARSNGNVDKLLADAQADVDELQHEIDSLSGTTARPPILPGPTS
jgi:hypothetical protein